MLKIASGGFIMNRPKIGLALGSGASRGLAHIGVLKALEEARIPVDMIAGTSAGALVGALFCCGVNLNIMQSIADQISRKSLLDLSVPKIGFIKGNRMEELVKLLTRERKIEDLNIPFRAVATDIVQGKKVVFDSGYIYKAVRASFSIPAIFTPVYMEDQVLVDGALVDRVPVGIAREMGADIVIGVDVGFSAFKGKVENILDVIFRSINIMEKEILKSCIIKADVLIKPYLPDIDPSGLDQVDECCQEGYSITKMAIPAIKKIIADKEYSINQRNSGFL